MLIDIHTHNLEAESSSHLRFIVGKHYLGIHPWDLVEPFELEFYEKQFEQVKKKLDQYVIGIGECGLDRRRTGVADIGTQMDVLGWHFDFANKLNMPIILHCVRAYSDLLHVLKIKKYNGKILLHDYNGNEEVTLKLRPYDCYFSFGRSLFNRDNKAAELLKLLPREKIFLESDSHNNFSFESIYQRASFILGMDQVELEVQMEKNLVEFFSDLDNISSADIINNLRNS